MNTTHPRSGSTLIIVIILIIALTLITGSVLSLNLNEQQRIVDKDLLIKSRYAAEAVLEYGAAQLRERFDKSSLVTQSDIDSLPLSKPPSSTFNARDNIVTSPASAIELEVRVGTKSTTATYIDPTDPSNANDPLSGRNVFIQNVVLYAKATARDPSSGRSRTSYAMQTLLVRDAPPTSGAIQYMPTCEIAPGATMDIYGPVYCYGNMYVQTSHTLSFHDSVTARNNLYHGVLATGKNVDNGDVLIKDFNNSNAATNMVSMRIEWTERTWNAATSTWTYTVLRTWLDSNTTSADINADGRPDANTGWAALSAEWWGGNVKTQVADTSALNPFGFPDYQPNNPTTPVRIEQDGYNASYDLIRSAIPNTDARYPVVPATAVPEAAVGTPGYAAWAAYNRAVSLKNIELSKFEIKAGLYIEVTPGATSGSEPTATAYKWTEDNASGTYERAVDERLVAADDTTPRTKLYKKTRVTLPSGLLTTTDLNDYRRGSTVRVVDVDISKLNTLIRTPGTTAATRIGDGTTRDGFSTTGATADWNGVVYIKNTTPSTSGVRVTNARTLPSAGTTPGFTLATNSPLYVKGNYNADGANVTNDAIRTPDSGEVPAALVADAITFLSSAWSDSSTATTGTARTAANTEVAAAIMTGIVPTKGAAYSGGVENLPRFLESWSNEKIFGYRGSMLVFFESEIATQAWGSSGVYNAPKRVWGYSSMFASGVVVPGFPLMRDYRRATYRDTTKAIYDTGLAAAH
jgi:hypothetical protein